MARVPKSAEPFVDTWEAFKRPASTLLRVDTDMFRVGWPKPTIYREHEAIHVLCNMLDHAQDEVEKLRAELTALRVERSVP